MVYIERPTVLIDASRVRRIISDTGLDVVISSRPENLSYLSGVTLRMQGYFVRENTLFSMAFPDRDPAVVIPWFERYYVEKLTTLRDILPDYEWAPKDDNAEVPNKMTGCAEKSLAKFLAAQGLADGRIGVDDVALSWASFGRLRNYLPKAQLVPATEIFSELRMVKTPVEINRIESACNATVAAYKRVYEMLEEGVTELQLASIARDEHFREGADEIAFMYIVAGARAGIDHVVASDHPIKTGELVKCDMGCRYQGYVSDIGRTFICGTPSSEQRRIYRKLLDTHTRILEKIAPGIVCSDLFQVYFTGQKGDYGEIPWDICGHGLGLEIHEMPGLMPTCQRPLEAGMVLAVEVGYLCPEKVGYQLEDVVLVTDDGFRNLTNFDKELV